MEIKLLDFVQECKRLAKQALGKRAGEPASGGFARWKHLVLHCIRIEDEYSYRELVDRVAFMDALCEVPELDPDELPKPSTLCKAFDRLKRWVWRQLLRVSRSNCPLLDTAQSTRRTSNVHSRRFTTVAALAERFRR